MPRKLREFDCACGCGGKTRGGEFLPGHDQTLRTAIEAEVGGLLQLQALVEKTLGRAIDVPETVFELTPKGEEAKPSAGQNIRSWERIRGFLLEQRRASLSELAAAISGHEHEAGEKAFIWYCRRLGWLKPIKQ